MNPVVKSSLAILFVGGLATVLTYPLVSEVEPGRARLPVQKSQPQDEKKDKEQVGQPSPAPTPAPADQAPSAPVAELRNRPFLAPIPKVCFRPERARRGADLIAAAADGRVTVASTGGERRFSFGGSAPLGWSAGGRYLASGDGALRDGRGRRMGRLFGAVRVSSWAWSPVAQCGLGLRVADGGLVLGKPHWGTRVLVRDGVESFSWSPEGGMLAYLRREGEAEQPVLSLWIARLTASRTREIVRFSPSVAAAEVGPWLPSGRHVLFWTAPGESVLADGATLRAASAEGRCARRGVCLTGYPVRTLAYAGEMTTCVRLLVGIAGTGREATTNKALALIFSPPRAQVLTNGGFAYGHPSCSPDGTFIATVRAPEGGSSDERKLVLIHVGAHVVRELTPDDGLADEFPEWGPQGTGLLFVRRAPDTATAQVWFIGEGGSARSTGLTLDVPRPFYGFYDWAPSLDWSATPPTGIGAR